MILGWECGSQVDIALSIVFEIFTWILQKYTHTHTDQHSTFLGDDRNKNSLSSKMPGYCTNPGEV